MIPKISIIMPIYNGERFLKRAIDSVLAQTYKDFELICIDDGSTDNSLLLLEEYQNKIQIIPCTHKGAPAARNKGLAIAKGQYITFLDSDDELLPNSLALQLRSYLEHKGEGPLVILGKSWIVFDTPDSQNNYFLHPAANKDLHLSVLGATFTETAIFSLTGSFNEKLLTVDDTNWFMTVKDLGIPIVLNMHTTLVVHRHRHNLTKDSGQTARAHLELFRSRIVKKRHE